MSESSKAFDDDLLEALSTLGCPNFGPPVKRTVDVDSRFHDATMP